MRVGLDVGSTTIKCVVLDDRNNLIYHTYERHYSHIVEKSAELLRRVAERCGREAVFAISGSAGMGMAESVKAPFVQEVFATRVAANRLAPGTDVIIELGGEDAKILFLTNGLEVRMNGSCAGLFCLCICSAGVEKISLIAMRKRMIPPESSSDAFEMWKNSSIFPPQKKNSSRTPRAISDSLRTTAPYRFGGRFSKVVMNTGRFPSGSMTRKKRIRIEEKVSIAASFMFADKLASFPRKVKGGWKNTQNDVSAREN